MASGTFPSSGSISILQIKEAYGTLGSNSLLSLGNTTARLTIPYSLSDFYGLSYCCVEVDSDTKFVNIPLPNTPSDTATFYLDINPNVNFYVCNLIGTGWNLTCNNLNNTISAYYCSSRIPEPLLLCVCTCVFDYAPNLLRVCFAQL